MGTPGPCFRGKLKNGPRFWVRADSIAKARASLPAFVEFDCGDIYRLRLPLKVTKGGRVLYERIQAKSVMREYTWAAMANKAFDETYGEWAA